MSISIGASAPLIVKVAIATAGRRQTLSQTLELLDRQTSLPAEVLVCPAKSTDCDTAQFMKLAYPARCIQSAQVGTCAQRNATLRELGACDIVVFFDDDFYPSPHYLAHLERLFQEHPEVVGATGNVLADGAVTSGISHDEALRLLASSDSSTAPERPQVDDAYALYGCNMAVRVQPQREFNLCFDEALPLYGWLEDIDFSRRLSRHGRLVRASDLTGVHLAEKRGRSRGLPLGYSQVANPWYMLRKGTIEPHFAATQVSRNVAANAFLSLKPEPWVDRRGRLCGNALAAVHLLCGQLDPRYVTRL